MHTKMHTCPHYTYTLKHSVVTHTSLSKHQLGVKAQHEAADSSLPSLFLTLSLTHSLTHSFPPFLRVLLSRSKHHTTLQPSWQELTTPTFDRSALPRALPSFFFPSFSISPSFFFASKCRGGGWEAEFPSCPAPPLARVRSRWTGLRATRSGLEGLQNGTAGHAGCAAHAQACGVKRRPGEDPEGEPSAAGAPARAPPLTLSHLTPSVTPQLATPAASHAAQQQHPQAEALYRGTHMVGAQNHCRLCVY